MTKRKERLRVCEYVRRFDKKTEKFVIDIAYSTAAKVTPRTVAVSEAFGFGVDQEQKFAIYDNVELKIGNKDIVLITGESGSGKSVLLKALSKDIRENGDALGGVISVTDVTIDEEKPLIETVGKTVEQGLELLSRVGLNDAFLFLRTYEQLSDGQRYRYRIAKMIESGAQWWVLDEFCATLDRDTAKIVAFNVQKLARQQGRAVLAATTHTDLLEDLAPSVHVNKRYGKEITIDYYPNVRRKECSLTKEMRLEQASLKDYEQLSGFHYRDQARVPAAQKVFALKRKDELVGVIVYRSPGIAALGRLLALGRKTLLAELNRDFSLISRVVVHPKYRTMGLGEKLVKDTLFKCGRPYVETIAVMARYNPFFERANMTKIATSTAHVRIVEALKSLEAVGFDSVYLSSEAYNLVKLKDPAVAAQSREILKTFSRRCGVYNKRLLGVHKAFPRHKEFCETVDNADTAKLAKMLRILSFLAQPKVYLFWKNPALNFIAFLGEEQAKVSQLA